MDAAEDAPLSQHYDPPEDFPALPADLDHIIWSWSPDGGSESLTKLTYWDLSTKPWKHMSSWLHVSPARALGRHRIVGYGQELSQWLSSLPSRTGIRASLPAIDAIFLYQYGL